MLLAEFGGEIARWGLEPACPTASLIPAAGGLAAGFAADGFAGGLLKFIPGFVAIVMARDVVVDDDHNRLGGTTTLDNTTKDKLTSLVSFYGFKKIMKRTDWLYINITKACYFLDENVFESNELTSQ